MNAIETELRDMLREFVGEIIASSIVIACTRAVGRLDETLSRKQAEQLISMINSGLKLYLPEVAERQRCESRVTVVTLSAPITLSRMPCSTQAPFS